MKSFYCHPRFRLRTHGFALCGFLSLAVVPLAGAGAVSVDSSGPVGNPPAMALETDLPSTPLQASPVVEDDLYEMVLQVKRKKRVLSKAFLAYQSFDFVNPVYYVPMKDLAQIVGFDFHLDLASGQAKGWYLAEENSFLIDVPGQSYSVRGERFPLAPDDVFIKEYGPGFGEIYMRLERLNDIWPLALRVDFQALELKIDTAQRLPFEGKRERMARHEDFLERQGRVGADYSGYETRENPYQLYSPPVVDLEGHMGWDSELNNLSSQFSAYGTNDLLGFSADYNFTTSYDSETGLKTPDNLRLKMTRQAFGDETMPLGVRRLDVGDVSAQTSDWIRGHNDGRGVAISSVPLKRNQNFDEITVEGAGLPGWEVELYRNNQLLDFGVLTDKGEYRFEQVALLNGNNEIKVVLYGPQGQEEERVEHYNVGGALLPPGEMEYELSVVDVTDNLISFDDEESSTNSWESDGLIYSGSVTRGLNRHMSVFGTLANSVQRDDKRQYATAGVNYSWGPVRGMVEGYKDLGGGTALDSRLSTSLKGWSLNLRTALFNDFESDRAGRGADAQTLDVVARTSKNFQTPLGRGSLTLSGSHEKYEDGGSLTIFQARNSLAKQGWRVGHLLRGTQRDRELSSLSGRLDGTVNLNRQWRVRGALDYIVEPNFEFNTATANLFYRPAKDWSASLDVQHQIQDESDRVSARFNRDFGDFLGSVNGAWRSDGGVDVTLNASTSLAPFGTDDDYIMDAQSFRSRNALHSRVFIDHDFDGSYSEGDEALPGARLIFAGHPTDETDDEGDVSVVSNKSGEYVSASFDQTSGGNPFLISTDEGYRVLLRAAVSQNLDVPVIQSGVIDGTAYFENGNPVPGLRLQLVNRLDEVVNETLTAFDGFYTFELVPPGMYMIRADPVAGVDVPITVVTIDPDDLFVYGADVDLKEPEGAQTARRIENMAGLAYDDRQKKYGDILSRLKQIKQAFATPMDENRF